jgi:hypothetical protein
MLFDDIVGGLHVRTDQHRVELPRESCRQLYHDRRLLERDPDHHISASRILGHRFLIPFLLIDSLYIPDHLRKPVRARFTQPQAGS